MRCGRYSEVVPIQHGLTLCRIRIRRFHPRPRETIVLGHVQQPLQHPDALRADHGPLSVDRLDEDAFFERDPGAITLFPFTRPLLEALRPHVHSVLLTAGSLATQRRKVERLGLAPLFGTLIFVDPAAGEDKQRALAGWLGATGFAPAEVLVVGDRPDAEISAARALGCAALRIRGGEWARQPTPEGVPEAPDVRAVLRVL